LEVQYHAFTRDTKHFMCKWCPMMLGALITAGRLYLTEKEGATRRSLTGSRTIFKEEAFQECLILLFSVFSKCVCSQSVFAFSEFCFQYYKP
jgi:hypothetical protein